MALTKITAGVIAANAVVDSFGTKSITADKLADPRVVQIADGASVTIDVDITDIAYQTNTQGAGTLTINAPTGTPFSGQKFIFRLQSTNQQTFSWNAAFQGSNDAALPTLSTGSDKFDYVGFIYNSITSKWQMVAKNFGF
jgi:hypothetical protein